MEFKTLEELREHKISELERDGTRVIAWDWGFSTLTPQDLRAMAVHCHPVQAEAFHRRLRDGFEGEHHLWALVEQSNARNKWFDDDRTESARPYRYLNVWLVWVFPDGCFVRKSLSEGCGPAACDVPWSVWQHVRPDDAGAEPRWREEVSAYLKSLAS